MPAGFRLACVTMVASECDIIESFARHTLDFVDHLHIQFHNSYDSSRQIVENLISEGLSISCEISTDPVFRRGLMGDSLLRRVACDSKFDFLLPLDADEFIAAEDRMVLETELGAIPRIGALLVNWLSYVPTDQDDQTDPNPITRIRHRVRSLHRLRKVFFAARMLSNDDIYLSDGNHELLSRTGQEIPHFQSQRVLLAHFPVRCSQQLASKVVIGTAARLLSPDLTANQSQHWRALSNDASIGVEMPMSDLTQRAMDYLRGGEKELIKAPLLTKANQLTNCGLVRVDAFQRLSAFIAAVLSHRTLTTPRLEPDVAASDPAPKSADRQQLLGELENARHTVQRLYEDIRIYKRDYWQRRVVSPSPPEAATAAEPPPPLGRTQGFDFGPSYKVARFSNESWLQTKIEEARSWYRVHGRKVVILIPSYRDTTLLQQCINSVQITTNPNMIEILVVDDASPDESHVAFLTSLSKLHANITVIFGEKNVGFAGNVNRGLKVVSHDVVLMNSDVVAHEGWLEALQFTVYSTDSAIGTSRLLFESGSIQFGGGMRSQTNVANFDHFHRRKPPDYLPALVSAYTFYATGAVMYLRFNTLKVLSYFDPAYEMAFEDVDYCIRAWSQGLRVVYAPASCLNHKEGAIRGYGIAFRDREKRSQDLFWTKQKSFFERNVRNCEGKPQVIFVCETTGVGGGHRVIYNFLNHLSSAGFDAQLWNLEGYPNWFPLRPSVTVRVFGSYYQLAEALDQQDAIKVATWWKTSEPVWLGSVRRGIPVYLVQDIESSYYTGRDDVTAIKVLSRYRPEFNYATITQWVKSELATSFNFNAVCVGVGYQDDKFHPLSGTPRRKRTILVVARSEPLKNFAYSQDILRQLSLEGVQVLAYGSGIHRHLVQELGSVEFFSKPSDDELCELYNQADFFLQTSRHEGFSLPPLEAMACGCAVVTTDAMGNREYISDGKNCIVVPIDNSREAVRKILAALADDQLQHKIRAGGVQTTKLYAQNFANKRAEKFFRAIVSRPEYGVQIRESDLDTHH
jgi:glycosyltransferase involved in cell wall biosynthesis